MKSADISNSALESGLNVFRSDTGGLYEVQAEIMLAMILPEVARLLPLWGVPRLTMSATECQYKEITVLDP